MKLHVNAMFDSAGGVFTLEFFAIHWGNRTVGFTLLNVVFELEF